MGTPITDERTSSSSVVAEELSEHMYSSRTEQLTRWHIRETPSSFHSRTTVEGATGQGEQRGHSVSLFGEQCVCFTWGLTLQGLYIERPSGSTPWPTV